MKKTVSLIISDAYLNNDNYIVIKEMKVIDNISGELIKIAKINDKLLNFIKDIEITLDDFLAYQDMKKKNPNIKKLVDKYKLYNH